MQGMIKTYHSADAEASAKEAGEKTIILPFDTGAVANS